MAKPKNEAEDNERFYDADKATKEEVYCGKSQREDKTLEDVIRAYEESQGNSDTSDRNGK